MTTVRETQNIIMLPIYCEQTKLRFFTWILVNNKRTPCFPEKSGKQRCSRLPDPLHGLFIVRLPSE